MRRLPFVVLAAAIAFAALAATPASIEPKTVVERLAWGDRSLVLLDVRTPEEFAEGHLPGAINIPHTELAARIAELEKSKRPRHRRVLPERQPHANRRSACCARRDSTALFHLKGDYLRWSGEKRPVSVAQ